MAHPTLLSIEDSAHLILDDPDLKRQIRHCYSSDGLVDCGRLLTVAAGCGVGENLRLRIACDLIEDTDQPVSLRELITAPLHTEYRIQIGRALAARGAFY